MASRRTSIFFFFLVVAVAISHEEEGPAYGYTAGSSQGPENWWKLSSKYKLCGEGKRQSPINIVTKQAVPNPNLDSLNRTYARTNATLIRTNRHIKMAFATKVGDVLINGKPFSFENVHWHAPSEHTINGQSFPLEFHLLHRSADGEIAVIAVLYKLGDPDSFFVQLRSKLAELAKDAKSDESRVEVGEVDLRSLQKRTGSYFRYMGSLTTPPCTENVVWSILGKVRELSKEQLSLLTAPLPFKDARPSQPLNGRTVAFYNPPNSTVSFDMHVNFN